MAPRLSPGSEPALPKRTDIDSILIIGAGPIVIGQACEFDYSGAQACKALKARGLPDRPGQFEPGDDHDRPGAGRRHLYRADHPGDRREDHRPRAAGTPIGALLPTMGGQTALNTAMALAKSGALERHGVELIGASEEAIDKAEDRQLFRQAMDRIGLVSPKSRLVEIAGRGARGARRRSGCRRSSGRPLPWAAPAAASPTTPRNSRRSSAAGCAPRRRTKC